jgi:hypothetical protein
VAKKFVSGGSRGEVPEWPKGADCKSAGDAFEGSNPSLSTNFAGIAQLVERKPSKLGVAGSSPVSRSTLVVVADGVLTWPAYRPYVGTSRPIAIDRRAQVAQSVEHVLGKDEVSGSIPLLGFAFRFGEFGESL